MGVKMGGLKTKGKSWHDRFQVPLYRYIPRLRSTRTGSILPLDSFCSLIFFKREERREE